MTYSSSLADNLAPLILDTSVLINLHASTHGGRILDALPNEILVPEIVAAELEHETSRINGERQFLRDLTATGHALIVPLDDREYGVFGSLVSGSPSLGDGEAATVAIALYRGHKPVIDERKGRMEAKKLAREPGWSLDLFCHSTVLRALGEKASTEALYLALRDGRMRIHEDHCDYVVGLIGVQHALDCNSLPGYKTRRRYWRELICSGETTPVSGGERICSSLPNIGSRLDGHNAVIRTRPKRAEPSSSV
jgi:predicted nucleic acid-binding protein